MGATSLTLTPPDAEWMAKAACAGNWELMEDDSETGQRAAKDLCASCPVWEACRAWTLSLPGRQDVAGIAGGLTEKERERRRRAIRRSRPSAPAEPPKECTACGETKPAGQFYLHARDKGRRDSRCSACRVKEVRARRAAKKAAMAS